MSSRARIRLTHIARYQMLESSTSAGSQQLSGDRRPDSIGTYRLLVLLHANWTQRQTKWAIRQRAGIIFAGALLQVVVAVGTRAANVPGFGEELLDVPGEIARKVCWFFFCSGGLQWTGEFARDFGERGKLLRMW